MTIGKIAAGALVIPICLVAVAQEPQLIKYGRTARVKAFAWTDPSGRMISPWQSVDSGGGAIAGPGSETLLYDNFEAGIDGDPTDDCYGHDCGQLDPSARWFNGTSFLENQRQYVVDDMVVAAGAEGVPFSRIQLAFYWGPCPEEPMDPGENFRDTSVFIQIKIFDDVSTDCLGLDCDGDGTPDCPAMGELGSLVIECADELRCADPDVGYTIVDLDLFLEGEPPIPMPVDGRGGYSVLLAREYFPKTGQFTLAHSAQMMLWGNTGVKVDNPSDQEMQYWVDRNGDQRHAIPGECFTAFFPGLCPVELGAMVAFYVAPGLPGFEQCSGDFVSGECDEPCDMDCDGNVNAFDIEPFLGILFQNDPQCVPNCTGDVNGDGVVNAFDIEPFLNCLFP